MGFQCNVCGQMAEGVPVEKIDREIQSCPHCGSSVRFRSIVHLLSLGLFGRSMPLPDFPESRHIVGIGLSDWDGYAVPLADKVDYTNTYYHQEPFFDICKPVGERESSCDFMISTEMFEHVPPPAQVAFTHALQALKPGGTLILTVPFTNNPETSEHFPELHDFRILNFSDTYVLVNKSTDGRFTLHENLVFHGGPGLTLEMRVYSRAAIEKHLANAGFVDIHVMDEDVPQWGILHKHPWSLPILAKRPGTIPPYEPPADLDDVPANVDAAAGTTVADPAPLAASAPTTSSVFGVIPGLLLAASVALGIVGLVKSGLLSEALWTKSLLNQTMVLFAGVGGVATAACFAAAYLGRKSETALGFVLLAFTLAVCGPAATLVVLFFLLASWCLGNIVLQRFGSGPNAVIAAVTGWSIYAMLFTLIASIPVNVVTTHAVLLGLPILIAAARPAIRSRIKLTVMDTFGPPAVAGYGDVVRNAGLVVCTMILALHIAMVALPDRFFDALLMHLYIPSFMAAHGAWSYDPGSAYAFMPNAADMLYASMYLLQGETAARLLNFSAFFFTCLALFRLVSLICSRAVAVWTIALLVSVPLTFIESSTLFVENTVMLFLTAAILTIAEARFRITGRDYLAILLLVAGACMVKLHGAIAAGVIGLIALVLCLRGRTALRAVLPIAAATVVVGAVALWPYVFAWLKTGNPVFPFYNHLFKSPFFPPVDFVDGRWTGKFAMTFGYDATFATGNFVEAYNGALGFTLFAFLIAGIGAALVDRNRIALFCGALGLFFVIAFASKLQYVRYLLIFLPLLMVPVAFAIEHMRGPRLTRLPIYAVVVGVVGLNMYKMPAGAAVLGSSDLTACCVEKARRDIEYLQVPERIVNRIINEQAGATSRVLYVSSPFGGLLSGTAIYTTWHNSRYAADFTAVKSEQDFARLIGQISPSHVVINPSLQTPLDKAAEAYLRSHGRLVTRVGWLALYALKAVPAS